MFFSKYFLQNIDVPSCSIPSCLWEGQLNVLGLVQADLQRVQGNILERFLNRIAMRGNFQKIVFLILTPMAA
jgi:hypothetical protein